MNTNNIQFTSIQSGAMQCKAKQCDAMQYEAMQYNVIFCDAMQCNVIVDFVYIEGYLPLALERLVDLMMIKNANACPSLNSLSGRVQFCWYIGK